MEYKIQYAFNVYRPTNWHGKLSRLFGAKNEGFIITAETLDEVKEICRNKHNLNPFYLTIQANV